MAQPGGAWSDVIQLSDESTFSQGPALALDRTGGLHAFWSSRPVEDPYAPFAIAHSVLVSGVWLPPQEIVLSPGNRSASIPHAVADLDNNLHLFWATSGWVGDLYYSLAPASQAHSARAWRAPELVAVDVYQHDVAISREGDLHLVYASQSQGICHTARNAGVEQWSEPSCFASRGLRNDEYDTRPRLALDSRGALHIVWVISDYSAESLMPYAGRAVCYAYSLDGGLTWSEPLIFDAKESRVPEARSQPEYPAIAVDAEDYIHIVWIGQGMNRYHIYSADRGLTWAEPQPAIRLGGYNNWMGLAASADGTLHFVTAHLQGLAYSYWDGTQWSAPKQFPDTAGAHYADALVAPNGSLHTVWQDHGGGKATVGHILYAHLGEYVVEQSVSVPSAAETALPNRPAAASAPEPPAGSIYGSVAGAAPTAQADSSMLLPLGASALLTSFVLLIVVIISLRRSVAR